MSRMQATARRADHTPPSQFRAAAGTSARNVANRVDQGAGGGSVSGRHALHPGELWAVTVADLLARVVGAGLPFRLAWPNPGPASVDEFPTGVLPVFRDDPVSEGEAIKAAG